jgi:hypothetical protein
VRDIASFMGVALTRLTAVVASLGLRRFADEDGDELVDLPDAPLPDSDTPAPVRFLPTWDATLLVHARRTQILPEAYRPLIFHTRMPPSYPTILVDGQVAGMWRLEDGRIELTPFGRLSPATRGELEAEAEGLAAFHPIDARIRWIGPSEGVYRRSIGPMNRSEVQAWLDRYVEAWRSNERGPIEALFTQDVVYRWRPYPSHGAARGIEAVVDAWLGEGRDEPGTWEARYEPYAVEGDRAVATGHSRYLATADEPEKTYYNAFLMRFASDGRCAEFTEYYMLEKSE